MLQYIIKLSISLSVVYLFYQLFLRRLTFYNWNRWYLLIYSMVCFVIPFINVFTIIVKQPTLRESALINYIPAITQMANGTDVTVESGAGTINWMQVTTLVIAAGMLLMMVRLVVQYYSLFKMRSKAVLLYEDKVKLYHIDAPVMPFSFGRGIYVNQYQHSEDELKEIIRHEFIHVKQRHSLDIIWSEVLCILNWYNPFAWLLRHDIRQNLEFIADQQVLQTGLDRKQYQYLLLKVIGVNSFSIATNFNFSSLKKRIAMMNKARSARVHLIRFLFLLPLLLVVLLAFRNATQHKDRQEPLKQFLTDTIPAAVKTPAGWKNIVTIDITDEKLVTLRLKNGRIEKYDLNNPKQKEAFERQYGALPEPPTPPAAPELTLRDDKELPDAPAAPDAPEKTEAAGLPDKPETPNTPDAAGVPVPPTAPDAPEAPEKPVITLQDCLNKKGYCITVVDNYGECVVIIKDKDNKILKAITLEDWNNDKTYEEKYGNIPRIPAPVKKVVGRPKTVTSLKLTPVEANPVSNVEVKNIKIDAKTAVTAKTAVKAKPVTEVVIIGKKVQAESVMDMKSEVQLQNLTPVKPDVIILSEKTNKAAAAKTAEKAKPAAEPKKQAAGQPEEEQ
ncbi:M56 family metallopeptidase [Longitalea luteola]|uniref:M56 family metallopeptidase n=1 Tax=Longitalea luteola TaxID=2812563 RepID=UPI001A97C093|nr:M56 family metallopeptidase [Longitalea luteola]